MRLTPEMLELLRDAYEHARNEGDSDGVDYGMQGRWPAGRLSVEESFNAWLAEQDVELPDDEVPFA